MITPYVHVPYETIGKYLSFLKGEEYNLEIYFDSGQIAALRKPDVIALKGLLDYHPLLTIHAPFMDLSPGAVDPMVREVTLKRFSAVLDFAEILKPEAMVFHSGYYRWKYDNRVDIWLEGSLETWVPVNRRALDMGVKIAIENIFEDEPSNLKLLMDGMNSENFGVCFDTGHFNLFSKLTLSDWLQMIKQYLLELHLHDNSGDADSHLAIEDGIFDFNTLFKELKDRDCIYTIEARRVDDVKKSVERLKAHLE